jgi:4'-phosphopantetheinyl transferase
VAIWLADSRIVPDCALEERLVWLSDDESARYRRFIRPQRQRQFLLGRILLRLALSELLGIEACNIRLAERPGRAPVLTSITPAPGFSISHSGPWVACGVSADVALGLDIELRNPERDLAALAQQAFMPEEAQDLLKLEDEARVHAFYELWSRKEAAYKLASAVPTGEWPHPHFTTLEHADLSIVLCSSGAPAAVVLRDPLHHLNS